MRRRLERLTRALAEDLLVSFQDAVELLDTLDLSKLHGFESSSLRHKAQRITNHC